jgi:hypothetical protein
MYDSVLSLCFLYKLIVTEIFILHRIVSYFPRISLLLLIISNNVSTKNIVLMTYIVYVMGEFLEMRYFKKFNSLWSSCKMKLLFDRSELQLNPLYNIQLIVKKYFMETR